MEYKSGQLLEHVGSVEEVGSPVGFAEAGLLVETVLEYFGKVQVNSDLVVHLVSPYYLDVAERRKGLFADD